mmetsp:Transcript_134554/g.287896  ORF Transcript_134554/g.287896 Transcript_134554/m.287896 type:complete len:211 (+) Transcript_134554:111-743(+)
MPAAGGNSGGPSTIYAFDPKAYAKAVMHSCKHSSEGVTGIFIGSVSGKVLKVVDCLPLFHTHALAPMLKVACMLIEQHCRALGNNLEIVGVYYASPSGAVDITPIKAIGEKIASNFSSASMWALDAAKLVEKQFALKGWVHSKDDWKAISADASSLSDEALKHTSRLVSEMKYIEVVDFDDHLAGKSLNWLNTNLFKGDPLAALPITPSE